MLFVGNKVVAPPSIPGLNENCLIYGNTKVCKSGFKCNNANKCKIKDGQDCSNDIDCFNDIVTIRESALRKTLQKIVRKMHNVHLGNVELWIAFALERMPGAKERIVIKNTSTV